MPRPKKSIPNPEDAGSYGTYANDKGDFRIRYDRPEVADYAARVLIANLMEYDAAASKMLNAKAAEMGIPPPTDEQIIIQARRLEKSPQIQKALHTQLAKIGLGDDAQKQLVSLMWGAAYGRNDKRWGTAMTLLAKISGLERKANDGGKPTVLAMEGLEAGMMKMFDGKPPTSTEAPDAPSVELEEE